MYTRMHEYLPDKANSWFRDPIRGRLLLVPRHSDGALDPGFRCAYMLGLTMNRQAATASLLKQAISESAYEF